MISLVFTLSILLSSPALIQCAGSDKNDPSSKSLEETGDLREPGRSECDVILGSWVGSVQPSFDVTTLTLSVNLAPLYAALQGKECSSFNQLWLELWWVTDNPANPRPDNFGSVSYFSKYERCHQLEPEHFVFHSTRRLDTHLTDSKRLEAGNSSDLAKFHHIVEHEYILRVCPCGRRIQTGKGNIKICDCEYSLTGKPHCSKLVNLDPGPDALVYPWCRQPAAALGGDADNASTKIVVHSPVVNCTSILFTGVMASCTPLQTYDRVQLSLHIVEPDDAAAQFFDLLSFECNKHQHFGQDDPIVIETNIHSINGSHGDFSVYVGMLQPQSVYCLQIELVDHPYCNSHLMIGHPTGPNPKVCASHVTRPVITPQCAEAHGQIVKRVGNSYYLIAILAVGLAAVIGLGVLCVACACIKMKGRSQTSVKGPHSKDYRQRGLHRPVSAYSNQSLENGSVFGPSEVLVEDEEKVFLLRLPNSSCCDDVHFMFFEWMESLGCHVHDLSNPDEDESINADPEGWVQEVLSHPNVKVVVIEGSGHSSAEAKELSGRCLLDQSAGPSSTCTATSSLTGSATSSVDGRASKSQCGSSHHNESTDTDPLLDDPRLELRIFAWKFIQNHFVGKYNQLLLVRLTNDNVTTTSQDTSVSLTPFRQSFLIPHHLPEVRAWLRPSKVLPKNKGETPRVVVTSQGGARDKKIAACEKRLCSAVLTSQYDCI